ncbi:MAG: hypothetical protein WC802_01525 [Patescibacteria group bacterium]|jgi:hypothetical protein
MAMIKTRSKTVREQLLAQGFTLAGTESRQLDHGRGPCCCWDDGYCGDCHRAAVYNFELLAPPAGMTPKAARAALREEIKKIHEGGHRTNSGGWFQREY